MFKITAHFQSNMEKIETIHIETCTHDWVNMKLKRMVKHWYDILCKNCNFEKELLYRDNYFCCSENDLDKFNSDNNFFLTDINEIKIMLVSIGCALDLLNSTNDYTNPEFKMRNFSVKIENL
jgi:hypothetical protein